EGLDDVAGREADHGGPSVGIARDEAFRREPRDRVAHGARADVHLPGEIGHVERRAAGQRAGVDLVDEPRVDVVGQRGPRDAGVRRERSHGYLCTAPSSALPFVSRICTWWTPGRSLVQVHTTFFSGLTSKTLTPLPPMP